jgi:hypothetical protein
MRFRALVLLLLSAPLALSQDQVTYESCRENVKLFYDASPISTLPAKERNGIIQAVLPDLKASEARMGFDPRDMPPEHLASLLRYKVLARCWLILIDNRFLPSTPH